MVQVSFVPPHSLPHQSSSSDKTRSEEEKGEESSQRSDTEREMALEALSSTDLLNFIIYDTISAAPLLYTTHESLETTASESHQKQLFTGGGGDGALYCPSPKAAQHCSDGGARKTSLGVQGRKKRRRRTRVCKNKEEAETQRMTHIAVERNRRKQMNEHLAVLRSLMPESYVQRGDQASIVGGAIEFVKELEHLLQSLEAQKVELLHQSAAMVEKQEHEQKPEREQDSKVIVSDPNTSPSTSSSSNSKFVRPPFSQFFVYPQYTWSQVPNNKYTSTSSAAIADIEVTLIETHANMRILCRRRPRVRQLSRLVAGFHTLHLSILHLNVTTMDTLVLYSISAKVEEGCQLTTVDDIAASIHHMLSIMEGGPCSSLIPFPNSRF